MKKLILLFFVVLCYLPLRAQLDSVFWFVAPEISEWSYPPLFDRPIKLNIASFNNNPVNVRISQPANSSFSTINDTIPPNGNLTVDLTPFVTMIENQPPNTILPYGLLIQTTDLVNIYYEITMDGNNPEIYSLKGRNALGTNFMIPGQNEYMNGATYQPTPLNRIDIVATENNTIVSITPSKGIVGGHLANVTFTINLNAGETYSCVALGRQPLDHLEGTVMTSNHPIAVTVSDDMLHHPGGGQDLVGDQIVPVHIIGQEYIAVKGSLNSNADKVYVLATVNNTSIYLNGNPVLVATINRGQTHILTFLSGTDAMYFTSDNSVYTFQLTGMGIEFGGTILPPIECTGSRQIKYRRATQKTLRFNICVPAAGINSFLFNGSPLVITAGNFLPVPGTSNQWFYASINIPLQTLVQNATAEVTNTTNFHLGVFEGGTSGGCSYAFFSDYGVQSRLQASTNHENIGHNFCEGDTLHLFVKDTAGLINIRWTFPDNSVFVGSDTVISNVLSQNFGMYIVNANSASGCFVQADTIQIQKHTQNIVEIYDTICQNNPYTKHNFNIPADSLQTAGTFEYQYNLPNTTGCDTIVVLNLIVEECCQTETITVTFKPDSAIGQDAFIGSLGANTNNGNEDAFASLAWTWSGNFGIVRSFLKFDELSTIPTNATILNAELRLFGTSSILVPLGNSSYPGSPYKTGIPPSYSTTNSSFIQRVTSTWDEQTITWNTQPTTDTINQITISETTSQYNWNFTDSSANLLSMIQDWVSNPTTNFGIMLRLETEINYRSLSFASSDHANSALHPELIITYEVQLSKDTTIIKDTICEGDTYSKNGFTESASGTYSIKYKNSLGCDSLIILKLYVIPKDTIFIYDTICEGDIYSKNGFSESMSGSYSIIHQNSLGCDNIITLNLNVIEKDTFEIFATICEDETYSENGFNCSKTGTYFQSLKNSFGCDSLVILDLYVASKDTVRIFDTICEGETYFQNGFNKSQSGTYAQNLKNSFGCDSTVVLNLTVNPAPDIKIIPLSGNFCEHDFILLEITTNGDSFLWNTGSTENPITIKNSGTYTATAFMGDCKNTADYTLEACPCELWLPNVFTPNGDGINDAFSPVAYSVLTSFSMHIFDRWGSLIHMTDTLTPWDGRQNGKSASAGVYYCVIKYSCANEPSKIKTKHGSVTLVR